MKIDLNTDMGEGFGPYRIADDAALMAHVTSVNVACGYHAGDPVIMERTVAMARERGIDLGAHVSFPDRMGFGRRRIDMALPELEAHVLYQLGALEAFARRAGHRITHMNPHGALGNLASADPATAGALVRATRDFDPEIAFLVLPGSALEQAAQAAGSPCARLFLADRAYGADGQLVPRALPGAVIHDPAVAVARVLRVIRDRVVETLDGQVIPMPVRSILIHSDTEGAVDLARALRAGILAAGGSVRALSCAARTED
ncbi:MAG TPA: 5-oxoprolinase subunit PxpA [Paracoccaceae bacterium]|nr:5-oxoprolinase subunit PxpA [Paracoccaceae bacterium]